MLVRSKKGIPSLAMDRLYLVWPWTDYTWFGHGQIILGHSFERRAY